MAELFDWRIVAIIAMLLLSCYNLVLKWFLDDVKAGREDIRAAIPVVVLAAVILFGYYLMTYKDIKTSPRTIPYLAALSIITIALISSSTYAYAYGELTVAVSIIALSIAASAILAVVFLGETFNAVRIIGILLALASILVLSFEKQILALIH